MNYEELVEILEHTAQDGTADEPILIALRAVVELHKPDDYCCPVCGPSLDICGVEYPCPTIQAIEKELR
jgi:hypothetical protein